MKIYLASSWRNKYYPEILLALREAGHEVYDFRNPYFGNHGFSWASIDIDWENWTTDKYKRALFHPIAQAAFDCDFNAMNWAEICIMVLPCGRSANTEAGWMNGKGKITFVISPEEQEPELMYKIHHGIYTDIHVLIDKLKTLTNEQRKV